MAKPNVKQGLENTLRGLSAAFGYKPTKPVLHKPTSRDAEVVGLYSRNGYLDRQISLNEALKLRQAEGPINHQHFPAMLRRGVRLRDGRTLRMHSATNFESEAQSWS